MDKSSKLIKVKGCSVRSLFTSNHRKAAAMKRWFVNNTFEASEFDDIEELILQKKRQGLTISLCLPTLNEEKTIADIIDQVIQSLVIDFQLLDEIVLVDSGSQDRTCEIAQARGISIYRHQDILPQYGTFKGKGEALWKSLYVLKGDIIVWIDTDIRNFHPRFVYGILGPLLREPRLVYSKSFYRRPIQVKQMLLPTGGGRVTELTARPLLNLYYPELAAFVQPLSGEYAVRRHVVESIPLFAGFGVEIGLLIDLLETQGLDSLSQVNLKERIDRTRDLDGLSKMAFAVNQAVIQRLVHYNHIQLKNLLNPTLAVFKFDENDKAIINVEEFIEPQRPPILEILEYCQRQGIKNSGI